MALNKFMHPRNIYKRPPDFKKLAVNCPNFRKHVVQELTGRVTIDFKNAEALRCLTTALLKQDFGLTIDLPLDRLIPTVPLRLNYILWLEDVLYASNLKADHQVSGIDIGTGSSCVYPLLGCKLNNWQFMATDIDEQNLCYAERNVEKNGLAEMITVKKAPDQSILNHIFDDTSTTSTTTYDFCMCNPPFFADHMEAQGLNSRTDDRAEPSSSSTASCGEQIVEGGEVVFVKKMIGESLKLQSNIRVFTSMVGKKSSLGPLKEELKRLQIPNFSTTEFCQGKTMRWGIGWSFDRTIVFPKSYFQAKRKVKPPLVYVIPEDCPDLLEYTVQALGNYIKTQLDTLKITYTEGKSVSEFLLLSLVAKQNTWSHMRRKRREFKKIEATPQNKGEVIRDMNMGDNSKIQEPSTLIEKTEKDSLKNGEQDDEDFCIKTENLASIENCKRKLDCEVSPEKPFKRTKIIRESEDVSNNSAENIVKIDSKPRNILKTTDSEKSNSQNVNNVDKTNQTVSPVAETSGTCVDNINQNKFLFKCELKLCTEEDRIRLEMVWIAGENRESMHQVFQYFKNQLKSGQLS